MPAAAKKQPKQNKISKWSDLTEESVRCRVNGHRWMPYDAKRVVGAFETNEVCERCKSHRLSAISNVGEVLSRSIKYADGFLSEQGRIEPDERNAMRVTLISWDYKL